MSSFDNKEKAEENKYARDQEIAFKVYARYHSLLAAWVAEELGLEAVKKEAYKKSLVTGEIHKKDEEKLFQKIKHELHAAGVQISDQDLHKKMRNILHLATDQIKGKK